VIKHPKSLPHCCSHSFQYSNQQGFNLDLENQELEAAREADFDRQTRFRAVEKLNTSVFYLLSALASSNQDESPSSVYRGSI
jgi:hypothetical protein